VIVLDPGKPLLLCSRDDVPIDHQTSG